jgi:hypothetical protein
MAGLWRATVVLVALLALSAVARAGGGFAQCTGDFNDDNSLFIINCAAFDDSETIVSATYSLNGPILSMEMTWELLCFHCHLLCRL